MLLNSFLQLVSTNLPINEYKIHISLVCHSRLRATTNLDPKSFWKRYQSFLYFSISYFTLFIIKAYYLLKLVICSLFIIKAYKSLFFSRNRKRLSRSNNRTLKWWLSKALTLDISSGSAHVYCMCVVANVYSFLLWRSKHIIKVVALISFFRCDIFCTLLRVLASDKARNCKFGHIYWWNP